MQYRHALRVVSGILTLLVAGGVFAQQTDEQETARPTSAEIGKWIEQLDDDKFAVREEATRKLTEAADEAIDLVRQAASGESREVASRAITVLRLLSEKDNKPAKAALEQLSQSDDTKVARRAKDALDTINENAKKPSIKIPAIQQMFPGGLNAQIQFGGFGVKTVKVTTVNGVKKISVKENDRKTEITDDPKKGIEVQVTEQVNGKPKVTKVSAKDVAELKKKHPEMHKIYEQYSGQNGIMIGGARAFQIGGAPIKMPGIPNAIIPNGADADALKQSAKAIAKARANIKDALKKVESLKPGGDNAEALKALRTVLEAAAEDLSKAESGLRK